MCLTVSCSPDGEADWEELLSPQVGSGGLQVLREGVRLPLAQTDLQRQHPQPPHGGAVVRLQSASIRRPEYPLLWFDTVLHFKLHTVVFFNSEVIFMFKKFKFCSSVFLNSTSLQTSTAVEVWRFRSAAAEEGSDTRSPTKDINPNSLSTSTKAGRETSGSSPAEPFQQNKSWTDSSSAYLKNFLLHELPVWSRVLCHVSLWHHETPVVKKYFVNVEEFLVLTSRSTEMLSFLHYTCPDY